MKKNFTLKNQKKFENDIQKLVDDAYLMKPIKKPVI
jgi:hypothetical protein